MKTTKVKQDPQQELIRAKLHKVKEGSLAPIIKKVERSGNQKLHFDSFGSFPSVVRDIYRKIYDDVDVLMSGKGVKVTCSVYPPGCKESIQMGSMSDSIALYIMGSDEVVSSEVNPKLLEMANIKVPKDSVMKSREIFFRKEGSYFMDEYPFSLVCDYNTISDQQSTYRLPPIRGGTSKNIRLSNKKRWVFAFSKLCGHKTVEKIFKSAKGSGMEKTISDALSDNGGHKLLDGLMKGKGMKEVVNQIPKESDCLSEDILGALDDFE